MSNVYKILEDVRKLSAEDQAQLLAHLGRARAPLLSEKEFVTRLRALGVLMTPQTSDLSTSGLESFQPAPTVGKPASEIIIEERR